MEKPVFSGFFVIMWYNIVMSVKSKLGIILASVVLVIGFLVGFLLITGRVFAEDTDSDDITYVEEGEKFVIIYDEGKKLTVKTEAKTVKEVLERAEVVLNKGDRVEPSFETEINMNNYFINIYRARPVIVKDGVTAKYLMSASYDKRMVAEEAGLTIYDGDEIEQVFNDQFLETGVASVYEVLRKGGETVTVEEEIPFAEEKTKDYNLAPGTSEIRQLGEVGLKEKTYKVLSVKGEEVSRELISERVVKEPVTRITAVGASRIEQKPLTRSMGRNRYTVTLSDGRVVERQETYYDLNMSGVMAIAARQCGVSAYYTVRADGVKVDANGYVLVAANLSRYPRCSVVETSLGPGKVYDTGSFAASNPEQFDIATDWTNHNGN